MQIKLSVMCEKGGISTMNYYFRVHVALYMGWIPAPDTHMMEKSPKIYLTVIEQVQELIVPVVWPNQWTKGHLTMQFKN